MATGRNDFPVALCGASCWDSLVLNVLLWLTTTSWSGWEPLSKMTCDLDSILHPSLTPPSEHSPGDVEGPQPAQKEERL